MDLFVEAPKKEDCRYCDWDALVPRLRWAEGSRDLATRLLEMLSRRLGRREALEGIINLVKEATGFEAVAIRLREGEDFPYYVIQGLPGDFVEAENSLCCRSADGEIVRDAQGKPVLECLCGIVLLGLTNPALPFFTEGGSFWTNSTTKLLPLTSGEDFGARIRNRCYAEGYESAALIPLRVNSEIVGLLQLNDRREGRLTLDMIRFLERLGIAVGLALDRIAAEEQLRKLRAQLESKVQERTADLTDLNERLRSEIIERKLVQEALGQNETRYRTLVETAKDVIWTLNTDLRFSYVSPSVTSVLGYTVEEIMSLGPMAIMTPSSRKRIARAYRNELTRVADVPGGAYASRKYEIDQYHKDGHIVNLEVTTTFLRDQGGRPSGILGISRDITDRKRIEQMKTEFVTRAAHEFRNPLTSIQGYSELLLIRDDIPHHERKECLTQIYNQARKLAAIVNDLLDIERIESGRGLPLNLSLYDVRETIAELMDYYGERSEVHRFELVLPETPMELVADRYRMRSLFGNILGNAVTYSPKGGLIRLTCESHEDHYRFSVEDHGMGMTHEQVEKIFQSFYRGDVSNTAVSGTGLGMTIAKNIVEAQGGKIWVDSRYGKGTTVRFTLPIKIPDAMQGEG